MIINSSNIEIRVEHQRSEFREITSSLDDKRLDSQFGSQLQTLLNRSQVKGAETAVNMGLVSQLSFGSGLVVTPFSAFFKPIENIEGIQNQEDVTRSQLWQSLLRAIQPGSQPLFSSEGYRWSELSEASSSGRQGLIAATSPVERQPRVLKLQLTVSETIEEYECTRFSSCGTVNTADGQSIEFDLSLEMERSYAATREYEETQELVFTDPLILNFDGNYADLSNEKFEFDLDADGNTELIGYLTGNSGMLALDRNSDGIINDGTELFGAQTGDGFAELADYDEDENGYIDEADSIFDQLLIWNKTSEVDSLESLKDKDIGAIYLGSGATPFDIKGEGNQHNGTVRNSGVYFTENGAVGTLQQIDMVV